ncbi:hypothetical protein HYD71_01030 [Mycoplasmopsis bovis]|nr:hypothetical protein [Mycoplasmopsis bovis]QQH49472.1 hypothetical protein HYD71_01030 [Mycoplasmopsis bovis]
MKKSQFPSIRFKEFTNAWEQGYLPKKIYYIPNRVKNSNNNEFSQFSSKTNKGFVRSK